MTLTDPSSLAGIAEQLRRQEFLELRATIRERGSARAIVSVLTFVSWAAIVMTLFHGDLGILAAVVPLIVLEGGFEVIFALHVGAERIGRYLFVFYESGPETPKWETAISAFGRTSAATSPRVQALTHLTFAAAALVNFLVWATSAGPLGMTRPSPMWTAVLAGVHVVFLSRVYQAVRQARGQRERDTAAFLKIAEQLSAGRPKSN